MGFDQSHYVPILKGRAGELSALAVTELRLTKNFTPLLEIPPIPPRYEEGKDDPIPAKTIDQHITDTAKAFAKALKALPSFFVDALYIETADALEDGSSPIDALFGAFRSSHLNFIPTIGLDRVEDYADSVKAAMQFNKRCCLRLFESDLEGISELDAQIQSLLATLEVEAEHVDLLIDFGPNVPQKIALPYMIDALPALTDWRSLTVASSSFPADMTQMGRNKIEEIEREEWLAWLFLRNKQKTVRRMPSFGDYAINHPVISEVDFRMMQMSPNIRYTDSLNFVVAKGQAQPRRKDDDMPEQEAKRAQLAPSVQYPKLAAMIMAHPSWKTAAFSWGDNFIEKCSRRECAGSSSDWRAVGTCHHVALVVQQLATLP